MKYNENNLLTLHRTRGAALIIAMLVVTAMTSIGFFVSRLNIRDTVQMTRLEQSMLAYYDAEAGIEQGLLMFRYDKNVETTPFATDTQGESKIFNIDTLNSYKLKIWYRQKGTISGSLQQDGSIDYNISKLLGNVKITCSDCNVFDPTNPNKNSLEYTTFQNGDLFTSVQKGLLIGGNATSTVTSGTDMILRLHAWGAVKNFKLSSTNDQDALDSGYTYIESVGTNGDTQRKLRISVNHQNGSILPIFDFVLHGQTTIDTPNTP